MENASKALIIAGAILLSILIISLGIMIFNQASGIVNNNSLSEAEISTFNNKFTQFEGGNVRGSNVNALITAVISNNNAAINAGEDNKLIELQLDSSSGITLKQVDAKDGKPKYTSAVSKKAQGGKVYPVSIEEYGPTGLVKKIKIGKPQ